MTRTLHCDLPCVAGFMTATHCNTLQHGATHCNKLYNTASQSCMCGGTWARTIGGSTCTRPPCMAGLITATQCNTLQQTVQHCIAIFHVWRDLGTSNHPCARWTTNGSRCTIPATHATSRCSAVQFVAVCCSVLQCVAVINPAAHRGRVHLEPPKPP